MNFLLINFDSIHDILNRLYEDMIPLCVKLTSLASAISCIGAMLYISYRVWKSLANAEAIDVFPLLRPFALCICIIFFKTLVIGGINGILSPIVIGTHAVLRGQTFDMRQHHADKEKLKEENLKRRIAESYLDVKNEEYDKQLSDLNVSSENQKSIDAMYEVQRDSMLKRIVLKIFRWLLEILFETASLIIDTIRTFYLIVLAILGPFVFAIASFDGFQATLSQWLTKYISVYLWLPVADLFGAVLARLQVLSLEKDMELMASNPFYAFNPDNLVYLVFMLIGVCGYFTVPSVASWIVQAGGFNTYNRIVERGSKSTGKAIYSYVIGKSRAQ